MSSDVNTMPKPEWIPNEGSGARFLAYSYALSGKEGSALTSSEDKAKSGSGLTGLMEELKKTKLDV